MLCHEFEEYLTDYIDRSLPGDKHRACAEHVLRCPVCHELLGEVKTAMQACRVSVPPAPSAQLETRVLQRTVPQLEMGCKEFEEHLTDYLDGFLPAPLYQRWQRHAARCERCTELPGAVVRSIGACYLYLQDERPVPQALHERILQTTLGTTNAHTVQAALPARIAAWWRGWQRRLDVFVSPQLATMAAMLAVAILVSATATEGSTFGSMYRTSLRMAAETYARGASTAARSARLSTDFDNWPNLMSSSPHEPAKEPDADKATKTK